MHIEHIALWTRDLERLRAFYQTHFGATAGPRYESASRPFASYILTFTTGARLELMHTAGVEPAGNGHFAVSTGSREAVDRLTAELRRAGVPIVGEPRATGDGYYESVVADPDGNLIEITV